MRTICDSWSSSGHEGLAVLVRDFVDVPGTAEEIGAKMSVRGLALEGIERTARMRSLDFDVRQSTGLPVGAGIAREIATAYGCP